MKIVVEYVTESCILIEFPNSRVLFDPAPGIEVNWKSIDFILLSHYKQPFIAHITEYTSFQGTVLTTLPTSEFLPLYISDMFPEYNEQDIYHLKTTLHPVSFLETIDLSGLKIKAISAGTGIGYANWILTFAGTQIAYSHSWTRQAKKVQKMDTLSIENSHIFLIAKEFIPPKAKAQGLLDLWSKMYEIIKNKGNLLFPVCPIEELFELINMMHQILDSASVQHVPIHIISPNAKYSISLMNIYSEWMSSQRQELAMIGRNELLYDLMEKGKVICHEKVSQLLQYPEPRIVFCHPNHTFFHQLCKTFYGKEHTLCLLPDTSKLELDIPCRLYQTPIEHITNSQLKEFIDQIQPRIVTTGDKIRQVFDLESLLDVRIENEVFKN